MHRRELLSICGALAAGAGCSGNGDGGSPTPSGPRDTATDTGTADTTPTPTPETTPATPRTLSVSNAAVQPGVVSSISENEIGVVERAGQYFVAAVSTERGPSPAPAEIGFRFDGATVTADEYDGFLYRNGERDVIYANGTGWLVFPLPETGDASDASLVWPGGEWQVPEELRQRLAAPQPPLSVAFRATDRVGPDETPTLALAVTNTGTVPTRAVLALNRSGPNVESTPTSRVVADLQPGETKGGRQPGASPYLHEDGDPRPVTYHLDYPGGEASETIRPADGSTDGTPSPDGSPTPDGTQQTLER
ncbi:MAG: hypothetical protein ABEH35_01360 [Haloarculaceae archaeon]